MNDEFSIVIDVKTVSEANRRTHWRDRQRRAKRQRALAAWTLQSKCRSVSMPLTVTLTRIAPGKLDDDNLQSALKAVRDGVADAIGVDDGDSRYEWKYAQERGADYRVRIAIAPGGAA